MMSDPDTMVRTGWSHPTVVTSDGSRPTSSCASRSAASGGSSPSSRRPPGKLDLAPVRPHAQPSDG